MADDKGPLLTQEMRGSSLALHTSTPTSAPSQPPPPLSPVETPSFKGTVPDVDVDERKASDVRPTPNPPPTTYFDAIPGYEAVRLAGKLLTVLRGVTMMMMMSAKPTL